MRSVRISRINKNISEKSQKVNACLHEKRAQNLRVRRQRPRSENERIALTEITKASVERAKREGKMKMIGERKMYYDPAE